MAKKIPAWQLMGLDGPPPVTRGYHDYGTVYDPARDGRPLLVVNLVSDLRWALWSYKHWWPKVRRGMKLYFRDRLATLKGEVATLD